jgi:hypothetical protein
MRPALIHFQTKCAGALYRVFCSQLPKRLLPYGTGSILTVYLRYAEEGSRRSGIVAPNFLKPASSLAGSRAAILRCELGKKRLVLLRGLFPAECFSGSLMRFAAQLLTKIRVSQEPRDS